MTLCRRGFQLVMLEARRGAMGLLTPWLGGFCFSNVVRLVWRPAPGLLKLQDGSQPFIDGALQARR